MDTVPLPKKSAYYPVSIRTQPHHYNFSNLGLVFWMPESRAALTSLDWTWAEFQIAVYRKPAQKGSG